MCCKLCGKHVTTGLHRSWWGNLATNVVFPSSLLQVVNKLEELIDHMVQDIRTQLADGLLTDLVQVVRFLRVFSQPSRIYQGTCKRCNIECRYISMQSAKTDRIHFTNDKVYLDYFKSLRMTWLRLTEPGLTNPTLICFLFHHRLATHRC